MQTETVSRDFEWVEGLRAAFGIALSAAIGLLANHLVWGIICSFATLWLLMCDVGGAYRQKAIQALSASFARLADLGATFWPGAPAPGRSPNNLDFAIAYDGVMTSLERSRTFGAHSGRAAPGQRKRSRVKGSRALENPLFFKANCEMLYGDAKESITRLIKRCVRRSGERVGVSAYRRWAFGVRRGRACGW